MRKPVDTLQYFTGVLDKPVKIFTKYSLVQISIPSSIKYHWTEKSLPCVVLRHSVNISNYSHETNGNFKCLQNF